MKTKIKNQRKTQLSTNTSSTGTRLCHKVQQMINNGEPISAQIAVFEMGETDGINAAYNIKTNKFTVMREAQGKVTGWELENTLKGAEAPESVETDGTE